MKPTALRILVLLAALTLGAAAFAALPPLPAPAPAATGGPSAQPTAPTPGAATPAATASALGSPYVPGVIYPSTVSPAEMDAAVLRLYRQWKAKYIKANPYESTQNYVWYSDGDWFTENEATVSEAHGYGMLLCALMAAYDEQAQPSFDGLYRYYKAHPSSYHSALMAWQQADNGKALVDSNGADSATDGDMDIAYALLLADRQWGSAGAIDYRGEALRVIQAIWQGDVNQSEWTLKLGDWASDRDVSTRPSDFMFGHLKAFARATGDDRWHKVADTSYALLASVYRQYSPDTGLIPDFLIKKDGEYRPAGPNFLESEYDGSYNYNACRVPWRVSTDYLRSGDDRALAQLTRLNAWMRQSTGLDPANIRAGYRLDGTAIGQGAPLCFTAPLMVSAMIGPENQQWLDRLWAYNMGFDTEQTLYYDNTLRLLCAVVVSGNWLEP